MGVDWLRPLLHQHKMLLFRSDRVDDLYYFRRALPHLLVSGEYMV